MIRNVIIFIVIIIIIVIVIDYIDCYLLLFLNYFVLQFRMKCATVNM